MKPCKHFWLIEAPDGPVSEGRCKHCGEVRGFFNSRNDDHEQKMGQIVIEPRDPAWHEQKQRVYG